MPDDPDAAGAVAPPARRGGLRSLGRALLLHPFGQFWLFIVFLYQVKEFYPFTHVPMYSDPEPRAPYLYLADAEGGALGVRAHCGVTNPKLRKMFRSRLADHCAGHGLDKSDPPQAAVDAVAAGVFAFLRERAEARRRPLPPGLQIMHVLIEPAPAPDGFTETTTLYAVENPAAATPATTP